MLSFRVPAVLAAALLAVAGPASAPAAQSAVQEAGTTNLQMPLKKAAEQYMAAHPAAKVNISGTSSGAGIASIKDGSVDIAASDVAIDDPELVDTNIGTIGFAFITGPDVTVKNLTHRQVQLIFAGKITNWKQLGGKDLPIVLISPMIGGGTRFVFEQKITKTTTPVRYMQAAQIPFKINDIPGALSYIASYYTQFVKARALSYEGVAPTPDNIRSHRYGFWTSEHLYTRKDAAAQVNDFVSYVKSNGSLLESFGVIQDK
jgi:phosphate transport system substrate-binding protein